MIGRRVFGIETEFGCFVRDERVGTSETVVEAVKNYVFHKARLGLIDLTARDEAFEPARSGGFLINGGRLYIDAVGSHSGVRHARMRQPVRYRRPREGGAAHRLQHAQADELGRARQFP
jgi:hypothetical protein